MTEKERTDGEIRRTPGVCGGSACVGQTRIPVWQIVAWKRQGMRHSEIAAIYPDLLSEDDVAMAWSYYLCADNRQEVEQDLHTNKVQEDDDG